MYGLSLEVCNRMSKLEKRKYFHNSNSRKEAVISHGE